MLCPGLSSEQILAIPVSTTSCVVSGETNGGWRSMSTGFPLGLEIDLVDEQEEDEDPLWDRRCLFGVERGVDGLK